MKKILLLLSALCVNIAFANPIDPEKALETANGFWASAIKKGTGVLVLKSPEKISKSAARLRVKENEPQYYICTPEEGNGFVIVSGDDALAPIVGYSVEGGNGHGEMPVVLVEWLNEYSMYVDAVRAGTAKPVKRASRAGKTAVAPMLKTTWDQTAPYNNLCPEINGQKTPTGCTATAMAQIMKFHEWPVTPKKAITWESNITGKKETIDLTKRTYNWDNMLDHYRKGYTEEQAHEVAQLMVDVGKAISSSYSLGGTGSNDSYAANAFVNVFDYSKAVRVIKRTDTTEEEYVSAIRENLMANRPVLYIGTGINYEGGHAFVCDGIDENDMLHIDWGWSGAYNGYFDMTYMAPAGIGTGGGTGSYNVAQAIIVNIAPSSANDVSSAAPLLYKLAIFKPETENELYNYTAAYAGNKAKFRVGTYILNRSHSVLDIEFALGVEQADGTYRVLESVAAEESLKINYYMGYYLDLEVDVADKNSNYYFGKGTHCLRVLYKDADGKFVKMNGDQNRLMLDVNDSSAKIYMALPDINVSAVELADKNPRVGSRVRLNARFVNRNAYNTTVIMVPIVNTTLSDGRVVRDTLKTAKKIFEVYDNRDVYVEFNTSGLFKQPGQCNITFAYNLGNYYINDYTFKSSVAESVDGGTSTITIKEEEPGGTPVATAMRASDISNGKVLDISATVSNQSYAGYEYSGTLALAIRNTGSGETFFLAEKEDVELAKNKSVSLSYKSADYFPTLPAGNYEVLVCELEGNSWEAISQSEQKYFNIVNDTVAVPYISGETSIGGKSVMPGDSVDVSLAIGSFNGVFDGFIRINTTTGLTPVLRSDYIKVAVNEGETVSVDASCVCSSKSPEGKWDVLIKYYDKNKRELGTMSNNTFTYPDNGYFWVGEPEAGIEEVAGTGIGVTVSGCTLSVHGAAEGSTMTVYGVDARVVYDGAVVPVDLETGVYVVVVNDAAKLPVVIKASVK